MRSLEAALWAFQGSSNFAAGALLAVNLGDDADTTGAIYGQLVGAYYGADAIPAQWRRLLAKRELIEGLAEGLFTLAATGAAMSEKMHSNLRSDTQAQRRT